MKLTNEQFEELAALHALGLLEGAERSQFETAIADDAALRARFDALVEASTALAHTAPSAAVSAGLRDRIMDSITTEPQSPITRVNETPESAEIIRPNFGGWLAWGIAAVLALSTVAIGTSYLKTSRALAVERQRVELAEIERQQLEQSLEAERLVGRQQVASINAAYAQIALLEQESDIAQLKISSLASLLGDTPEAQAIAVWNPLQQKGVLTVSKLPALAADKDYQLWVVDPDYPNPVDGGVFTVDPATGEGRIEFSPDKPIKQIAKFAVSLERKGGVPKAEGPMVLLSL
mgnify:CR=1 FL=1